MTLISVRTFFLITTGVLFLSGSLTCKGQSMEVYKAKTIEPVQ